MLKYKYNKSSNKFTENGHTMFEEDIFQRLKRLSLLEEKIKWIPVEEKEPECELQDEGIFYSKYLEIKVKGYEHPFIGFYVLANDDQFFDFIHKTVDEGIKQDEITHYRFVL